MRVLLLPLFLAACDFGHLGNPLTLPARGAAVAVENSVYAARRKQVTQYLAAHEKALQSGGAESPAALGLFDLAGTPVAARAKVLSEIRADVGRPDWLERATIIVMVHSS